MTEQAQPDRQPVCVSALYRFVSLPDFAELRAALLEQMQMHGIRGTVLLAPEGINGTIAGGETAIDALLAWLAAHPQFGDRLNGLDVKKSWTARMPFLRSKVKLKKEIVTMGVPGIDPRHSAGTYVAPRDWNALISEPDVITIDTRNDYEVRIGTFRDAVDPGTQSFREFPAYVHANLDPGKHRRVAMFCTGGIRCEKSTAYLRELGFEEVYHLQGGILKYLEEVPPEESLWQGECFVFDERVAVDHELRPGHYTQCHACRMPLSEADLRSTEYEPGVSCPWCHDEVEPEQRARYAERQKQVMLARERGETHLGEGMDNLRAQRRDAKRRAKERQRRQSG